MQQLLKETSLFKHNIPLAKKTTTRTSFGFTIGTGVQALIKNNWYATIFGDYIDSHKTLKHPYTPQKINLGGFLTGLGLQYKFQPKTNFAFDQTTN